MALSEETPVALEVFPRECEWSTPEPSRAVCCSCSLPS